MYFIYNSGNDSYLCVNNNSLTWSFVDSSDKNTLPWSLYIVPVLENGELEFDKLEKMDSKVGFRVVR